METKLGKGSNLGRLDQKSGCYGNRNLPYVDLKWKLILNTITASI